MSYTGYLITSAKLDLNWWLSLSQCPQGGNSEIKSSGSGKVGFQCHELRRSLSTHTLRRGWRAGAAAEGRTDPAQPKSAESPPTEGCVGKATPASSHTSVLHQRRAVLPLLPTLTLQLAARDGFGPVCLFQPA